MKLVIATNNKNKLYEMRQILGDFFTEIVSMKEIGLDIEIEETGSTFEENAFIKAKTVTDMTGLPALADDSGLCVDALNGAPGIFSARFAGEEHDDSKNIEKLLRALDGEDNRKAYFTTVLVLCFPDGNKMVTEGKTFGEITTSKHGTHGFGYDPVFYSYELNKTFGESTDEEKNAVSHRGKALRNLEKIINDHRDYIDAL